MALPAPAPGALAHRPGLPPRRGAPRAAPPPILAGSHDPLLEWAVRQSGCGLALRSGGSLDGLAALADGEAVAAATHLLDPDSGAFNEPVKRDALPGRGLAGIVRAWREQGLVVAPGNPHVLAAVADLVPAGWASSAGSPARAVLFTGTVRENIAYGRLGATEAAIREAARRARLDDVVAGLPQGLDTPIGERGVRLSGGQKQRLAIARVFFKNPPNLVLDEATSALDTETERAIQQSLAELAEGRTTLVIAHRLATIRDADRIVVLTEAGIAEQGTHVELLAAGEPYRALHDAQFGDLAAAHRPHRAVTPAEEDRRRDLTFSANDYQ